MGRLQPKHRVLQGKGAWWPRGCGLGVGVGVGMLTGWVKSEKGNCSAICPWGAKELELGCTLWGLEPAAQPVWLRGLVRSCFCQRSGRIGIAFWETGLGNTQERFYLGGPRRQHKAGLAEASHPGATPKFFPVNLLPGVKVHL